MSLSKEVIAGITVGSIVGGILGYLTAKQVYHESDVSKSGDSNTDTVHKSTSEFSSVLDKYIINNSLREPEILVKLREYTCENVRMSVMLTDPVEAQLFCVLLKMLNAKKCIEVGTYTGYNALNMALCLPEDGIVYALDINEEYVNHGRQFFEEANVSKKIDIRIGSGSEGLETLIEEGHAGTIDLVFIDADKASYKIYYEKALVLLKPGGIVALDNTFQGGRVLNVDAVTGDRKLDVEAINNLNKMLKGDKRVMISLLKIADGVTLCLKL